MRITPLGSLVDPDENWMNATSSGEARCSMPRTETSAISSRKTVRFSRRAMRLREAVVVGVGAQAVEHLALGGERRRGQAREHAEELGLVLVRVAGGERHRDDAAEHARPERVDEGREAVDQDHGMRAGACARILQVAQDAERASAQLARTGRGARCDSPAM